MDDGKFDVELHNKTKAADKAFKTAKHADNTGKNDKLARSYSLDDEISQSESVVDELDDVCEKYCESYNAFCEAVDYINDHYEGVVRVAKKHVLSTIISFFGWAISVVLSVILYFLGK